VRRWVVLAFLLAGCSSPSPGDVGGDAGGGGESGSGGSGGGGGTGGGGPILSISSPEEGALLVDKELVVEGTVQSDVPLRQTRYLLNRRDLQTIEVRDGAFSFEVTLEEGANTIEIGAEDRDGRVTKISRTVTYENAADRPPVIERFEADADSYTIGSLATLSWRVTGSQPIELYFGEEIHVGEVDVTGTTSVQALIDLPDVETFTLRAINAYGQATAKLHVGIGSALRVLPGDVIIDAGAQQRIVVENAVLAEWSTSGGTLTPTEESRPGLSVPAAAVFTATESGTYTIHVTDKDHPSRTGSMTIEVREIESRVGGFVGIGGQFGYIGWAPTPVVDRDGTLWVQSPPAGVGVARWRPIEEAWTWVSDGLGDAGQILQLADLPDGSLIAGAWGGLYRLGPGAKRFQKIPSPLTEGGTIVGLEATSDGALLVAIDFPPGLWRGTPGGSFDVIAIPPGLVPSTVSVSGDGTWYLGGTKGSIPVVMSRSASGGDWSDTGMLPISATPPRQIAFGPNGEVVATSHREIFKLEDDRWSTAVSPLTAETYRVAFDGEGRLVVPGAMPLVVEPGRVTRGYGRPNEAMSTAASVMSPFAEPFQAVVGDGAGGIYALGNGGVYHAQNSDSSWTTIGVEDFPPSWVEIESSAVADDGALVIGTIFRLPEHSYLYRFDPQARSWSGFGDDLDPWLVDTKAAALATDKSGNLYMAGEFNGFFRFPVEGGPPETLPWIQGDSGGQTIALGIAGDGTLFAARQSSSGYPVYKLAPGADDWVQEPSLQYCYDFLRISNGDLFAACWWPMRLANGSMTWTWDLEGMQTRTALFSPYVYGFAPDGEGGILAATKDGVLRRRPTSPVWTRFGSGEPSMGTMHVAHGGGRFYCGGHDSMFELDPETSAWVRIPNQPAPPTAFDQGNLKVFLALRDGRLVVSPDMSGLGLFATFDD